MRVVLMNLQNSLFAEAVERSLQEDGDFRILNTLNPNEVIRQSEFVLPEVVFLEVTRYTPWKFSERIKIRNAIKKFLPNCKIVLMVDENLDMEIAELVKHAKIDGLIDGFVFSSVTMTYLSAFLQTV